VKLEVKKKQLDEERYRNCTFKPERLTKKSYDKKNKINL
jgi:hypothetical protein